MSTSRIPVGLVGVTGYTGMELARLLAGHSGFELVRATSRAQAGQTLADIYPFVAGFDFADLTITEPDPKDLAKACELVFLAVPHGAAQNVAAELLAEGLKVVDLSADFRLKDAGVYEAWYKTPHTRQELLPEAVFGLIETHGKEIPQARLIANPGCYVTSAVLALTPALKHGLVEPEGIVVDSKSGTTGAGRKAQTGTLFCEVSDSFRAYGLATHRHTPEIEQEISLAAGRDITISFNPHLIPMNRGILSTCYTRLKDGVTLEQARQAYEREYGDEPWIRLLPQGKLPETRHVRGTMFCDMGLVHDPRTNRLIIVSVIDNLCRGASGQAMANANLICGLPVETGLNLPPLMP